MYAPQSKVNRPLLLGFEPCYVCLVGDEDAFNTDFKSRAKRTYRWKIDFL